jgi:Sec-independent protein translocase protein TatA
MDIGMGEILLILIFALLVYGGRLPEVARSLGRALATVKRNLQETSAEVTRSVNVSVDDETESRPRTVRRAQPAAPEALAKEDVSATAAQDATPPKPPEGAQASAPVAPPPAGGGTAPPA